MLNDVKIILQLEKKSFLDYLLFQLISQMFSLLQLLPLLGRYLLCKNTQSSTRVNNLIDNITSSGFRQNIEGEEKQRDH